MTTTPRRRGFSLIELLVVMALLAVLAAIAVGAYFRVRAGAEQGATESTLSKLNSGLDRKWKAVLDQAAQEAPNTPDSFKTFCGNDPDRIRVVYTYMKLKNEFPTTVAEATTPVAVTGLSLPAKSIFTPLTGFTGSLDQQSAACFYLSLTQSGVRGETFDASPLQGQTRAITGGPVTASVFVDAWGTPIAFFRMPISSELNAAPYTRVTTINATTPSRDPIDPLGRLNASWGNLGTFWDTIRNDQINRSGYGTMNLNAYSVNNNWVPTLVSAGADENFGTERLGNGGATDPGRDNVVSYRLRREGAKGN